MKITFEELRKSNNLLVDEKYLFYKINRFLTEKKYTGFVDSNVWWYKYFDKVKNIEILYYPGIEPKFRVYVYNKNYRFTLLYLKVLKNREISAYFEVDDHEFAKNPSVLKDFQIKLCKILGYER
jgi:hypothetical protein